MKSTKTPLLITCSLVALSACSGPDWNEQAGVTLNNLAIGGATLNNRQFHTGERDYMVELNKRFSSEVLNTVNFEFNSAVLDDSARSILQVQAHWISQFPEVRFKVYGHTDAVGTRRANKRLGQRRANAVVAYLSSLGIDKSRLDAAVSFGEDRPLVSSMDRERLNRRTVTEVTGFVQRHPMVLDGKYAELIRREYIEGAAQAPSGSQGGLEAIASSGG